MKAVVDPFNDIPLANRLRTNNFCDADLDCQIRRKAFNSNHQEKIYCKYCLKSYHKICINPHIPISQETEVCSYCASYMFLK